MQNSDEILPVILHLTILKRPPFLCFSRKRPGFWCVALFWVVVWVCKRNWANKIFFLEIIGGAYMPPPLLKISWIWFRVKYGLIRWMEYEKFKKFRFCNETKVLWIKILQFHRSKLWQPLPRKSKCHSVETR